WYFNNPLPVQLRVKALDANNRAVPGVVVTWAVTAGGGAVSPLQSTTDGSGVAGTTDSIGSASPQTITATPALAPLPTLTFTATLPLSASRRGGRGERSGHLPDRQSPNPLAGQREDRVAHRGRDGRRAGLADAALRVGARHDVHLDRRHAVHPQHRVVVKVALLHPAAVDRDLAVQRRRQAIHNGALHLRLDDVRIHHGAAIDRAHHPVHARHAVRADRDLGALGDVAVERLVHGDAAGASRRRRRAPPRLARRQLDDREVPRRLGQQRPTIGDGILFGGGRQLVDEAFHGE